jgi:hypothetical protein
LAWLPGWPLISAKLMEIRRRRVLIVVIVLFTVGLPVIFLGIRLIFHLADPKLYGPAGSPGIFAGVSDLMNEFGFIVAATLGATAGTTDLTDGMFRHLVLTGRSRFALYLARIPAGLAIIVPLAGAGFAVVCLVTAFLGTPQPSSVHDNGVAIPVHLSQAQLGSWIVSHPQQAQDAFIGPGPLTAGNVRTMTGRQLGSIYGNYTAAEAASLNPSPASMAEAGLWIELDLLIAFTVGLGLGSLMGQRTVPIILLIFLDVIITPLLASHVLPYFLDGQRLIVGVAMDQLQPAGLVGGATLRPGGGGGGNHPALQIPPMPTWAMIAVIVGWIGGWSALGAWRMATRDA